MVFEKLKCPCPYCNTKWIEEGLVCEDCRESYDFDVIIGDALLSLAALRKMNPDFLAIYERLQTIKDITTQYTELEGEIQAYFDAKD